MTHGLKRRDAETDTQGESQVATKAEIGMMGLQGKKQPRLPSTPEAKRKT